MTNTADIPRAPSLPIGTVQGPWRPLRLVLVEVAQAVSLLLLGALVDGVEIRLTLPAIVATLGLFTFVLSGLTVVAVSGLLPGFEIAFVVVGPAVRLCADGVPGVLFIRIDGLGADVLPVVREGKPGGSWLRTVRRTPPTSSARRAAAAPPTEVASLATRSETTAGGDDS